MTEDEINLLIAKMDAELQALKRLEYLNDLYWTFSITTEGYLKVKMPDLLTGSQANRVARHIPQVVKRYWTVEGFLVCI